MRGGGLKVPPPLFFFLKTIEKLIRLCTVLNFFLSGGCEDRDMLWVFLTNLSIESIYQSLELREKWPYLQNYQHIFFNTLHKLVGKILDMHI